MKKVIDGKVYNTETAEHICTLECRYYPGDFGYHDTGLYRTKKSTYFLHGTGGPMTMWAQPEGNTGRRGGSGLRVISADEAREYAEDAGLEPEEMIAAGFEIEEG